MKKIITLNIGNKGAIISVINGDKILDVLTLENFTQESLPKVLEFFKNYKSLDVKILLDTVSQNYNYKILPPLNYFDLQNMINRKFATEIPKSDLKQKKFLYKSGADKKNVFLFVSASVDSPLKEWLNFFNIIPNNLTGIYMIPLEAEEMAKKILISNGMKDILVRKNSWVLIIFHDKASDLRQVAIFNNNIVFTRLISFDNSKENLIDFIKQDIVRTSEYIKRFDTDFSYDKLTVLTILDKNNKLILKDLKMDKILFLNYTPFEISNILKLSNNHIKPEEGYSDTLLSLFSIKNKKKIRFGDETINLTSKLTTGLLLTKTALIFIIVALISFTGYFTFTSSSNDEAINDLNTKLQQNRKILSTKLITQSNEKYDNVNDIIEAGMIKDLLDAKFINPVDNFQVFAKTQGVDALTSGFKWYIEDFDYQNENGAKAAKTLYELSIINPDGVASRLFNKYDALNAKLKSTFGEDMLGITGLPNNINFNQKYLTFPIKVEILEKGPGYINNGNNF